MEACRAHFYPLNEAIFKKGKRDSKYRHKYVVFQSSQRGLLSKRELPQIIATSLLYGCFNPLNEAFFQKGLVLPLSVLSIFVTCFNPLNEAFFQKEHLHFTIDSLGRQGAFLHTPATPAKNKLLLCKLDGLNKNVKRSNP
jgi:hypothetical protein